jgi:hypothetical protein
MTAAKMGAEMTTKVSAETESGHLAELQACVAEYRAAMAELRALEERMTRCVRAMRAEGAPRERLLAASLMVGTVRDALKADRPAPQTRRRRRAA